MLHFKIIETPTQLTIAHTWIRLTIKNTHMITLEQILPHIPHELKTIHVKTKEIRTASVNSSPFDLKKVCLEVLYSDDFFIPKRKPVLFPLSMLNEEVEIDIGLTGGIVTSDNGVIIDKVPMPTITDKKGKNKVDITALIYHLKQSSLDTNIDLLVFEDLHSLYTAGKTQTWSLAYQCGITEAIAVFSGIKYMAVQPKEWQEVICKDIPPIRKKNGKIDTKARAYLAYKKLYPMGDVPKSKDGIIDAILINHYAILIN